MYKVLTLWQPWATLYAHGIKKIETRPKPTNWTAEKGSYLIHAAQKWSKEQERICLQEPFRSALIELGYMHFQYEDGGVDYYSIKMDLGQIIGSVEVTECKTIHNKFSLLKPHYFTKWNEEKVMYDSVYIQQTEEDFGDYTDGRYAWISKNPRLLETPIPYKGGQGYYVPFKGDESKLIFKK